MIFFFDAHGNLNKYVPQHIHQGSNKANSVYFLSPQPQGAIVNIAFRLPHGALTPERIMTPLQTGEPIPDLMSVDGVQYSAWYYELPEAITQYSGELLIQFYTTNANGERITTSSVSVEVEKGVPPLTPPPLDDDVYQRIIEYLAQLLAEHQDITADIGDIKAKNTEQDGRLDGLDNDIVRIDNKDTTQDNRLTAVETTNTEQDNRLTAIEEKNTTQDTDISHLQMIDTAHEQAISENTEKIRTQGIAIQGNTQSVGEALRIARENATNIDINTENIKTKQNLINLYREDKIYSLGDIVSLDGVLYVSKRDNNGFPPHNISGWRVLTSSGSAGGLEPRGSLTFEELPPIPDATYFKSLWNISNDFVTDDRFVEGAGKVYTAGTNVACIQEVDGTYKYDIIGAFTDLSSYATKQEVNTLVGANTDLITALQDDVSANNTDISTINKQIDAGGFLQTTQQTLTPEQKAQALKNANIVLSEKTTEHTEEIGHDSATGKLYSKTPIASADKVGGVKVGENLEITADGTLNAKGGGGIVPVEALPTASKEEYDKHLLYLQGGVDLKYIIGEVGNESNLSTITPLLKGVSDESACAVGTDCYIFGGRSSTGYTDEIVKYDTLTNTAKVVAYLPEKMIRASACAVGTDCYIFGGRSNQEDFRRDIVKYDTLTNKATVLSVKLPLQAMYTSACAVGTDCYIFGGETWNDVKSASIIKYDTLTNEATTLSVQLSSPRRRTSACAVGTDCYIFGGNTGSSDLTEIVKYDTLTNTIAVVANLPKGNSWAPACSIGTNCYMFGGIVNSSNIVKYNTLTKEVTTLSLKLPKDNSSMAACSAGNACYIFGGFSSGLLADVVRMAFEYNYKYKTITAV